MPGPCYSLNACIPPKNSHKGTSGNSWKIELKQVYLFFRFILIQKYKKEIHACKSSFQRSSSKMSIMEKLDFKMFLTKINLPFNSIFLNSFKYLGLLELQSQCDSIIRWALRSQINHEDRALGNEISRQRECQPLAGSLAHLPGEDTVLSPSGPTRKQRESFTNHRNF